jgi:hypothetical protein
MDDLSKALGEIGAIRRQMAQATEFRGYGWATLGSTGLFAVLAAAAQSLWATDPAAQVARYLAIWIVTAILSASLIAVQTVTRTHRLHSGLADEMIHMAVEQFLPAAFSGTLLTVVLVLTAPHDVWLLPGLWQIIYSLGVFSSCRFLPRAMQAAGGWYLLSGLTTLLLGSPGALSPWAMGIAFGVGQLIVAGVLFRPAQEDADADEA